MLFSLFHKLPCVSNLNHPQVDANTPPLFGGYLGLGADEERGKLR